MSLETKPIYQRISESIGDGCIAARGHAGPVQHMG